MSSALFKLGLQRKLSEKEAVKSEICDSHLLGLSLYVLLLQDWNTASSSKCQIPELYFYNTVCIQRVDMIICCGIYQL